MDIASCVNSVASAKEESNMTASTSQKEFSYFLGAETLNGLSLFDDVCLKCNSPFYTSPYDKLSLNTFSPNDKIDSCPTSYLDPVILTPTVLKNMIFVETQFIPCKQYLGANNSEIESWMRKKLATWMYEVCEEQKCRREVFFLAINYLDRFLAKVKVKKALLQSIGTTCIFIASKFKEARSFDPETLCNYTDDAVKLSELVQLEMSIVETLDWELAALTPSCFIDQIIHLHPFISHLSLAEKQAFKIIIQDFLAFAVLNSEFIFTRPSLLVSSCFCIAFLYYQNNMSLHCTYEDIAKILSQITSININDIYNLSRSIQDLYQQEVNEKIQNGELSISLNEEANETAHNQTSTLNAS